VKWLMKEFTFPFGPPKWPSKVQRTISSDPGCGLEFFKRTRMWYPIKSDVIDPHQWLFKIRPRVIPPVDLISQGIGLSKRILWKWMSPKHTSLCMSPTLCSKTWNWQRLWKWQWPWNGGLCLLWNIHVRRTRMLTKSSVTFVIPK